MFGEYVHVYFRTYLVQCAPPPRTLIIALTPVVFLQHAIAREIITIVSRCVVQKDSSSYNNTTRYMFFVSVEHINIQQLGPALSELAIPHIIVRPFTLFPFANYYILNNDGLVRRVPSNIIPCVNIVEKKNKKKCKIELKNRSPSVGLGLLLRKRFGFRLNITERPFYKPEHVDNGLAGTAPSINAFYHGKKLFS